MLIFPNYRNSIKMSYEKRWFNYLGHCYTYTEIESEREKKAKKEEASRNTHFWIWYYGKINEFLLQYDILQDPQIYIFWGFRNFSLPPPFTLISIISFVIFFFSCFSQVCLGSLYTAFAYILFQRGKTERTGEKCCWMCLGKGKGERERVKGTLVGDGTKYPICIQRKLRI